MPKKLAPAEEPLIISYKENGENRLREWKDPSYFVAWCMRTAKALDKSEINIEEKVKNIFSETVSVQALFQDEHLLEYSKEYPDVYTLWKFCYDNDFR